jgi:anaerobic dimethyl sulfoxide reductase subunit A
VKDGVITRVEPWAIDKARKPCMKGRALRQMIYNPNRLKYPLKRVGARGEGKFERISWDEALNIVAAEMLKAKERYGNSAILYVNSGGNHSILNSQRTGYRLLNMFGGCTSCWCIVSFHGMIYSSLVTYGTRVCANSWDDLLNSKLIILWAFNPADTWFDGAAYYLAEAKAAGIKIICVEPRFTDSAAAYAKQWIPIYPATDIAMLTAMAYVMIKENLQDQDFIDRYTVGFTLYRDYLRGVEDGIPKTPEWSEPITGVPAATIEKLAREYANTKPAALLAAWASGRAFYGEQFHRATQVLAAMTGNVGISGGWAAGHHVAFEFTSPPSMRGIPTGKNKVQEGFPRIKYQLTVPGAPNSNASRIHFGDLWNAVDKGKDGGYPADIKLIYVVQANPLSNLTANNNVGANALKKIDFMVVHEQLMTATAKYADIVLPVTTFVEQNDIIEAWLNGSHYTYLPKIIEPLYECKSDLHIFTELAPRLGIKSYNDKTDEEWLKEIVEKNQHIPDFEQFKKDGVSRVKYEEPMVAFKKQIEDPENNPFPTPSGKIEIYSQMLADMDHPELPPIPKYFDNAQSRTSPLFKKYPLQAVSVHFKRGVHFQFKGLAWLRGLIPHAIWINTQDAGARGIKDGDQVQVFNDYGITQIPAKVTERIMPGVVMLPESGQFTPDENGVDSGGSVNTLTSGHHTVGGSFSCNNILVDVKKV